jgi:hypothetical protein
MRYAVANLGQAYAHGPVIPTDAPEGIKETAQECAALWRAYDALPSGQFITSVDQDPAAMKAAKWDAYYTWWACDGKLRKMIDAWKKSPRPVQTKPTVPQAPSPYARGRSRFPSVRYGLPTYSYFSPISFSGVRYT